MSLLSLLAQNELDHSKKEIPRELPRKYQRERQEQSTTVKSEETKGFNKSDSFFLTQTVASMSTDDKNTLSDVGRSWNKSVLP